MIDRPTTISDLCDGSVHCITCSDALERVQLESISTDGTLGNCLDAHGHGSVVMLALVPEATVGSWLLVQAGAALHLDGTPAMPEERAP